MLSHMFIHTSCYYTKHVAYTHVAIHTYMPVIITSMYLTYRYKVNKKNVKTEQKDPYDGNIIFDISPTYETTATIKMEDNPAYRNPAAIKMEDNPKCVIIQNA